MLWVRTVATIDGLTSLHRPVFVVGVIAVLLGEGEEEHDVAVKARPAVAATATKQRSKERGRTGAHYTRSHGAILRQV
jgi:hypothetical protein